MQANSKIESESDNLDFKIDGHVDVLYEMFERHSGKSFEALSDLPVTLERMRSARVFASVFAFYCPDDHNGSGAAGYLSGLLSYAEKYLTGLVHIKSAGDLNDCIRRKNPGMIWLIENSDALLDIDRAKLTGAGIKVAGLTHMGRNRLGDGNNVRFPDGLTSEGKTLVKELGADGFAFDTAHLAEPGFRDLVRLFEGPLISSHTGVRALADIPRNLDKDQIRAIIDRKGIVGIAADPKMLTVSGEASIEDIFRHIDWVAQSFEADGIGIGTDFCGFFDANAGFEEITKLDALADIMRGHGYPEPDVRKILGQNWRTFYESLLR